MYPDSTSGEKRKVNLQHPDVLVMLVEFPSAHVFRETWGRFFMSDVPLSFEDVFNISLAVQNSNYADSVIVQEIINSDGFESCNRPGAQILEPRIARTIARPTSGCSRKA